MIKRLSLLTITTELDFHEVPYTSGLVPNPARQRNNYVQYAIDDTQFVLDNLDTKLREG